MTIQWFPGHMAKAKREILKQLKQIHLIVEIIDARIPFSSRNPLVDEFCQHKPRLIVLSKSDLADPKKTQQWLSYFKEKLNCYSIAINTHQKKDIGKVTRLCQSIMTDRVKLKKFQTSALMIVGIPNVGKSAFINQLAKRKIAKVENRPAVTQRQQWIPIGNRLTLLDTPGILWPSFESDSIGWRLSATGAIKKHIFSATHIVQHLTTYLSKFYPNWLSTGYSIDTPPTANDHIIQLIGQKRGCLLPGGAINEEKVLDIILQDFRSGRLGTITLETAPLD
ncbi:ribosome biogenesis GTPase YlqF [Candidatus Marinamargulisbacteria bacterium SCGC AG-410-N11]|nr:ribosome biogenesis GTPase YlqF [Candidatus Marinamargulisbacteria bacterium SCGC AG-410-N11]